MNLQDVLTAAGIICTSARTAEDTAEVIAKAVGPSGPNDEQLRLHITGCTTLDFVAVSRLLQVGAKLFGVHTNSYSVG